MTQIKRLASTRRLLTIAVAPACVVAVGVSGCAAPVAMTEAVRSPDAPKAIGPYSQAIKTGNLMFLSTQGPIDPKTNVMSTGTIEEQTKMNAVYETYFKERPPARGTVQVAGLPRGALVGISAVASK